MSTKVLHRCEDCGYTTGPMTPRHADYALRRHSCERWQELAAKRARYLARDAAVDRTPKPCLHKRARHEHGSRATYVLDRCRCWACSSAASDYETARLKRRAYGRGNYVDAGPAREHLRTLMDTGMGARRIATVSGVGLAVIGKLIWGEPTRGQKPSARIRRDNAERLLAVELDLAGGARIDGTGTGRRLQALVAGGWTGTYLADRLGVTRSNFTPVMHGRRGVTTATAQAVRRLYDELWNVAPPEDSPRGRAAATRARSHAERMGWVSALAWDDETIDDPGARPATDGRARTEWRDVDDTAVARRAAGDQQIRLTRAERFEVVRRLHAAGMSDQDIARRTGMDDRQVFRDRHSLGLAPITDPRKASA